MHSQSSADGDQRCDFKEKGVEIAAKEVSIVLLQVESAEKHFLATYAYLKNQYLFNYMVNLDFFGFVARQPFSSLLRKWA